MWVGGPGSLVDGELVAQREDFDLQRKARAEEGREARQCGNHNRLHAGTVSSAARGLNAADFIAADRSRFR
jgi:hypothetical protein